MASIQGGGNYRAIVAELKDEVVVVRQLMPDDPDPSSDELAQLAEAYRQSTSTTAPTDPLHPHRDLDERANGGLPVVCRVVDYAWVGPFAYMLTDAQYLALAGLE